MLSIVFAARSAGVKLLSAIGSIAAVGPLVWVVEGGEDRCTPNRGFRVVCDSCLGCAGVAKNVPGKGF